MRSYLVVVFVLTFSSALSAQNPILSDEFINSINAQQSTWTAGRNFPEDTPIEHLKRLNGALITPDLVGKNQTHVINVIPEAIPETFDGRTHWSQCPSLKNIRNQGNCGSCWAFGSVEVMTDRLCIASKGKTKFEFSADDLLACCTACGKGCDGGAPYRAFEYWVAKGIVSGGDYNSNEGCQPYEGSAFLNSVTPKCSTKCLNSKYTTPYAKDKHYGTDFIYMTSKNVAEIQTEIMNNGPVVTHMDVYEDFYSYKSGVYQHVSGNSMGGHAVKIIGWGTEKGVPYWLIANSWGAKWADLDGFYKILRGKNHCKIETYIYGGTPQV
ncbi:cathepsin B precursor [Tribolium castaneum]|uniref:Cathepsin B n=1 Tax=Tribolium castaneum TaxID=7070 RepID=D6WYL5_TRICA|nr:PREDICTED: cathepsin B isoform X1 [Tribolium castaneum]EFA09153.1 cathepsin B precursor [Tribolium castaneum]|eukprot:XP_015838504.1 PREDICTED: cathepsin B isoform X1 [Tribolium castaneum]